MKKFNSLRDRIEIEVGKNGVTVWLDNRWIIDASTILNTGEFDISKEKIKEYADSKLKNYRSFIIKEVKRDFAKQLKQELER